MDARWRGRASPLLVGLALASWCGACGTEGAPRPADTGVAVADTGAPADVPVVDTGAAPQDTGTPVDVAGDTDVGADAGHPAPLRRCPTSGPGAVAGDDCFLLTPVETGLPAAGAGATTDHYALRPTSGARGTLLLFLNGSGGTPRGAVAASPDVNYYAVARASGLHVLGVSYRSDTAVGELCDGAPPGSSAARDACFVPTRRSILEGRHLPGAAPALAGITPGEGLYARVAAALVALAARDPAGGWDAFLDRARLSEPAQAIRWSAVMASGHSQGGGHAALLGKLHAVQRVVMLASPCDGLRATPATWLTNDGSFATDPTTRFVGLGAPGDPICPAYPAAWQNLGMAAIARLDGAVVCAGEGAHAAPLRCAENAARWRAMLR